MKRIKRIIAVTAALAMTLAIGAAFVGCGPKEKTIAVIAKGETHAFWQAVKSGAEDAGKKYGYKITFKGPEGESTDLAPKQKEMISSAITNKADAIVLATIGDGFGDLLNQLYDSKTPVVEFDSGIAEPKDITAAKNPIKSAVATSNEKAAGIAATEAYKIVKADIDAASTTAKYKVGIIQHDGTATGVDRAKGFKDSFTAAATAGGNLAKVEILATEIGDGTDESYKTKAAALNTAGANLIFMCNEGVVKVMYGLVATNNTYDKIKFVGYDAGTDQIDWMKETKAAVKAKLIGSVAQNSIQIGYQAVEQAVFAVEGKTVTKKIELDGKWWNKANVEQMMKDNLVYTG